MSPRLPALTGGTEDALHGLYQPRDTRRMQSLEPVYTLEDLRRTGALASRTVPQSSLVYPGLSPSFLTRHVDPEGADPDGGDAGDDAGSEAPSRTKAPGPRRGGGVGGGVEGGTGGTAGAKGSPGRSPSPDQASRQDAGRQGAATAAARAALLDSGRGAHVVDRMEKGVAACAVLRDNRHFRLNSLGVFQPSVNDVRTRSMHRVELHKHLSQTNLRAPQGDKEVRAAVTSDTVGARLERMYNRVLRTVDEPAAPGTAGTLGGTTMMRRSQLLGAVAGSSSRKGLAGGPSALGLGLEGGHSDPQLRYGSPTLARSPSGAGPLPPRGPAASVGGAGGGGSPLSPGPRGAPGHALSVGRGGGLSPSSGLGHSPSYGPTGTQGSFGGAGAAGGAGGGGGGSPLQGGRDLGATHNSKGTGGRSADYWMRVTLPPEVIEAQLRHLAAATESNLRAYHDKVASAQDALLRDSGLGPEALALPPDEMEQRLMVKLGQIQETTTASDFNYSALSRDAVLASCLSAASKQLLTAASLPDFIRAALDHVGQHVGELATLSVERRTERAGKGQRRRLGRALPGGMGTGRPSGAGDTSDDDDGTSARPTASGEARPSSTGGSRPMSGASSVHWRPPPPTMPNASTPPPQLSRPSTPPRAEPEARVTEEWLEAFRADLFALDAADPDSPPAGILALPPLPSDDTTGAMDAGAFVRSRLERLWAVLGMPPHMRLDMVLYFTARSRALTFGASLELWEAAAAAVLAREAQVEALVAVQAEVESGQAERLSLGQLGALCLRVAAQTRWVAALAQRIALDSGWQLTMQGQPYPGADTIGPPHLLAFMEMVRQATEDTGLRH
ncbi:hypothetical protein HYH03_017699 [Edaphochlamys debaryana]|uniref:Uncharacterized protein n=1 Tax=Edaphochlamys debaryana TaxID=47281 RepID=A0A836BNW6_9CHLO|nr:hypothetical protein HYH03_017699 [Edaphochlamys debaryana]|eukprot:KAG2483445.1 hypothetical protein HYH03_017699 [Edaphochlamys debaryana]